MASGEYPGEPDLQRAGRRIVVGHIIFGIPPRVVFGTARIAEGLTAVGMVDLIAAVVPAVALVVLRLKPQWYVGVVNVLLAAVLLENLAPTIMLGGLLEADLLVSFNTLVVIGALIALSRRAGFWWFLSFLLTLGLAVVLPRWIDPIYAVEPGSAGEIAGTLVGSTIFAYAGMAYFVLQRDRFQKESDDLLHNILPDEIARRLKSDKRMIPDGYESASVLFADVVNFTPMSASMSPPELVGLLDAVFTTFDGFVEELGLEKIKTVGDEYMVASGVPRARPDHTYAIAELAPRIRDHPENSQFDGHDISLRIGINSGRSLPGSSGLTNSPTTCGATPSIRQAAWNPRASQDRSGYRRLPTT